MTETNIQKIDRNELRRRAEEVTATEQPLESVEEPQKLRHEMQIHQAELEMQNADLRHTRDKLEAALEQCSDLYDFAPVSYFTLDREGTINRVNFTAAGLLGLERSRLVGRRFERFVGVEARPAFAAFLGRVFASLAKETCEVPLLKERNPSHLVQIEAIAAASEQECRIALFDITERTQIITIRRELEAEARSALEKSVELAIKKVEEAAQEAFLKVEEITEPLQTKKDTIEAARLKVEEAAEAARLEVEEATEAARLKVAEVANPSQHDKKITEVAIQKVKEASEVAHLKVEKALDVARRLVLAAVINHKLRKAKEGAETALRQSEERYRSLFDTLLEGFCIIEVLFDADDRPIDFRFLEINPAFEAQTGLHNAQGKLMRELAPEHEAYWFEIYGKVALTGETTRFVNEAKALNRWYEVSAYRVGGQGSRKVAILFNDISESKRAEFALRESEERLRLFIEHAPAALAMFDRDMRYISMSRRWRNDYYLGDRELIGISHYEIFPEVSEEWKENHRRGLAGEVLRAEADRFEQIDGSVNWVKWEIRPWYDATGAVGGIVIFSEDITGQRKSDEALRESERRYSTLFANKINGIAHCRIITDECGRPVDYIIMQINDAYERIIGIKKEEIEGRRVKEVFPEIESFELDYIGIYGKTALEGGEIKFEEFFEATGQFLSIYAYSPLPGEFIAIFADVTERKRAEESLKKLN